ncbi:MAG: transporter [Bacteroidetes bacterium]|jgi:predicted Rossmann fold nucleotide-binding protein DprA/Smf involved in DNA uptake|nr:transporter [Bacteroidota bacterium]
MPADADAPRRSDPVVFALALDRMEGVGRVTAGRLLNAFAHYEDLRRYPREQVLARIQGAPNGERLVGRLFDEATMQPHFEAAEAQRDRLAEQRVVVLAPGHPDWPDGLDALPLNRRPFLLYTYGHRDALHRPRVALFAPAKLRTDPFEQAQDLVRHLLDQDIVPATGAAHGFDVVVHKLSATGATPRPSLLVAACGMAKLPPPLRPIVSAAVRAGGLFCSPFPMQHGPFDHDDTERALVLAALADACVFFDPTPDTPEMQALTWALEAERPTFGVPAPEHALPEAVHPLRSAVDTDWVVAAVQPA